MALATGMPSSTARNASPGALNLSSNNPFRNRTSPLPSPSALEPPRPDSISRSNNRMSTNPFLDSNAVSSSSRVARDDTVINGLTAQIWDDLSLLDRSQSNGPPPPYSRPQPRAETLPTQPSSSSSATNGLQNPPNAIIPSPPRRDLKPSHYRRNSESSVVLRDREMNGGAAGAGESSLVAGPRDRTARRERDRSERPPRTESEERRRRERRKERERRERERKEYELGKNPDEQARRERARRKQKILGLGPDEIDFMDETGPYAQRVHHGGPYDAARPVITKKKGALKGAMLPIDAFGERSANMTLGGSGPLRNGFDHDGYHCRGEEGFSDYATTRKAEMTVYNSTDRGDKVHGRETSGLGTDTFFEGTPASRSALQRQLSDEQTAQESSAVGGGSGLQRKKSLAQRLRGMSSGGRRERPELRSPESRYGATTKGNYAANSSAVLDSPPAPPATKALSAGGTSRAKYTLQDEVDPWDSYAKEFDQKGSGTQIRIIEAGSNDNSATVAGAADPGQSSTAEASTANMGRARAPSIPPSSNKAPIVPNTLTRSRTEDSAASPSSLAAPVIRFQESDEQQQKVGTSSSTNNNGSSSSGGLLGRMKSLRSSKRQRPGERNEPDHLPKFL